MKHGYTQRTQRCKPSARFLCHDQLTTFNRDFIPDSGKLIHLQTPTVSETVRVDFGFVAGDEVSSHYDPMIAKLIVQGPTREAALKKLRVALESYEVAGPITNIEFLKRISVSPDFMAGDVETGYIEKHREELFQKNPVPSEVWAQAALGVALQEVLAQSSGSALFPMGSVLGFGGGYQNRSLQLSEIPAAPGGPSTTAEVHLRQTGLTTFDITVNNDSFHDVVAHLKSDTTVQAFFPHTRLEATVIRDDNKIILFQQGRQYRLQHVVPKWTEKALGIKDVANSVLAPMPCKVLRVDVEEGEKVKKDQPLVVIESMKMETVIRSPQNGVISKVVHRAGVSSFGLFCLFFSRASH